MKITGLKDLEKALNKLPKELRLNAEKTALREGIKVIAKVAKSNASKFKDTGLLAKSIGVTVRKIRSGVNKGGVSARAGARTGFKKMVMRRGATKPEMSDPAKYAQSVEYGTSRMPARPYIAPAIASTKKEVETAIAKGFNKAFSKSVHKVRSRI